MTLPQQGFRANSGGSGLSNLTIENTLYVMKNGNDTTGIPNRLDKPYLTIYEASQNANVGDTIYVFSGTYNEGTNDIFESDVNYVLQEGVTVVCDTKVVSDFGLAKNINISGQGVLQTTSNTESVIYITNSNSVLNLSCDTINGNGICINCAGSFNIKANYAVSTLNEVVYLTDFLGNKCFGLIQINKIDVLAEKSAIVVTNTNTDLTQRDIYLYFNEINTNSDKGGGASVNFTSNNNTRIYFESTTVNQTNTERLLYTKNSYFFIDNTNFIGIEKGLVMEQGSIGLITNSNVLSVLESIEVFSNANIQLNNCNLKNTGNQVCINASNTIQISLYDCVIVSGIGISSVISLSNTAILRIKNCEIIASDPTTLFSIFSSNPIDIYVYGQCASNKPIDVNITNQITGTNIIVDSDIVQNTNNFF